MCTFCHKHGAGKTWYLQAENYSEELARDPRVRKTLMRVTRTAIEDGPRYDAMIRKFQKAPRPLRWLVNSYTAWDLQRRHHGQVVPMEDLRTLMSTVVTSVVRLPCVCRKGSTGDGPAHCMALTAAPGAWEETCRAVIDEDASAGTFTVPEIRSVEKLSPDETLAMLEKFEKEGLVHTLWTFHTPFVGGLCNCDPRTCSALRFLMGGVDVLAAGEYVAEVSPDLCSGCKACERRCPFGAMTYNGGGKAAADPRRCYGCGLCRTACPKGAVNLARRPAEATALLPWPA
jgi:ferredoxin